MHTYRRTHTHTHTHTHTQPVVGVRAQDNELYGHFCVQVIVFVLVTGTGKKRTYSQRKHFVVNGMFHCGVVNTYAEHSDTGLLII